ncbi:Efr3p CYBJADRAFT_165279 [Cyberlindnera jadinii NRRL Y-1542]|uniref:Protein EFR3 n=1 Tax=Cyberlindnera jadinii (strain ATCC 18201 / CBS 1600 / BCRC 20928 / JCM 3617 / NBRC 0987 / NRRL Y-1542) TaxID=983966 RepID=A0A1E4S8R7_CYBJN|nr:hypothetical protein CYBJADRAFT_165279 [Cyberlindnera jadinii NRRL Y-1542]ODV75905.1 hypothetical protein CYBJADRAFT_165279 [Cyberlindnera jadinii NRRL Y-1542]
MKIFTPKHQRFILQCYPSGRGADKKPNSSELSYLLYYASTRRVKLEKVGKFLEKKNSSDVYRSRTGNVQVTLEIIDALIKKCPDDVNVFAENVNAILLSVLGTKDLGLCQHALPVYSTLCKTLDSELFTGDFDFIDTFSTVTRSFFDLGSTQQASNQADWQAISLRAIESFASSKIIITGQGSSMVDHSIPLVLKEIKQDFNSDQILKRTQSHASSQHELSRFVTTRKAEEPEIASDVKIDELAVRALKSFFNTTSANQITSSTRAVAEYLVSCDVDQKWRVAIIEMVTNWIPVQLRFLVLSILLRLLHKENSSTKQTIYLDLTAGLLSSSVNLVGLSVIDHVHQLVELQLKASLSEASTELIDAYNKPISSLATHIYYQDQIIDMVAELTVTLKDYVKKGRNKEIIVLLDDIKGVMTVANENTAVQRTTVPLELFFDTFELISFNNVKATSADNFRIQMKYTGILIIVLRSEYSPDNGVLKPDYDNLITNGKTSVVNQFYEAIEHYSTLDNTINFAASIKLLELFARRFGINALVNAVPFVLQWLLENEQSEEVEEIMKDNLALTLLWKCSQELKYIDLEELVLSRIDYRKGKQLWRISNKYPFEEGKLTPIFELSADDLKSVLSQHSELKNYIDIMFRGHYRYGSHNGDCGHDEEHDETCENGHYEGNDTTQDLSFASPNGSTNVSLAMLVQPQQLIHNGDCGSIRSAPLSARSLMMGKLNVPRVDQLRHVVSGGALGRVNSYGNVNGGTSLKTNDVSTILNDLSFDAGLDDRGTLSVRR